MTDPVIPDIKSAKRQLQEEIRTLDGFIGIGVGSATDSKRGQTIRVYVSSDDAPIAKYVDNHYGTEFLGFPIAIVKSRGFKAQTVET